MSNQSFGSPASGASAASYAPPPGLRQRHSSSSNAANNFGSVPPVGDENSDPNHGNQGGAGGGHQSHIAQARKIPAPPPRASLASAAGRIHSRRIATTAADRMMRRSDERGGMSSDVVVVDASGARALVPARSNKNGNEDVDLSLWVVGYGYRNEAQFRALYHQLSSCGSITSRRGGLSCFGEKKRSDDDDNAVVDNGDNWVAVRYESALCAHKALCQHNNLVSVGGSTVIVGVMPLNDPGVAARFGVDVGVPSLSAPGSCRVSRHQKLRTEADILRDDGMMDNESKSDLDSLCGKFLAWFFMWD